MGKAIKSHSDLNKHNSSEIRNGPNLIFESTGGTSGNPSAELYRNGTDRTSTTTTATKATASSADDIEPGQRISTALGEIPMKQSHLFNHSSSMGENRKLHWTKQTNEKKSTEKLETEKCPVGYRAFVVNERNSYGKWNDWLNKRTFARNKTL